MKAKFVGTWELVTWNHIVDGEEVPFFGPSAEGILVYTESGHMSAQIMAANRPRMGMPPEEVRRAALNLVKPWKGVEVLRALRALLSYLRATLGYLCYAGTYEVDGDEVVHHVDLSLIPDWTGSDQRRRFSFESDDTLVLVAPESEGVTEHVLTWRRV